MSDFDDARAEVVAALAEYGEPLLLHRPATGYDSVTRKAATGYALTQTVQGRVDAPKKANSRFAGSETKTYERSAVLSPEVAFEPAIGDLIEAEGRTWRIDGDLAITRGGGVLIVIEAGLVSA